MILSPGLRPACLAGDGCAPARHPHGFPLFSAGLLAGTQVVIPFRVLVLWLEMPIPIASTKSRKNASTKCMNDPAASTMMRCQPGCRRNDLRLVGDVDLFHPGHAGDLDEAAERQRLDPVLGLAPEEGPERGAEAQEELGHLHAELLGRQEVPQFVQHDGGEQGHHEDQDADDERPVRARQHDQRGQQRGDEDRAAQPHQHGKRAAALAHQTASPSAAPASGPAPASSRARRRAQPSAARMSASSTDLPAGS